jgi:hypothetical protein
MVQPTWPPHLQPRKQHCKLTSLILSLPPSTSPPSPPTQEHHQPEHTDGHAASQQTLHAAALPAATRPRGSKTKPQKRTKWEAQRSSANHIPADEKDGYDAHFDKKQNHNQPPGKNNAHRQTFTGHPRQTVDTQSILTSPSTSSAATNKGKNTWICQFGPQSGHNKEYNRVLPRIAVLSSPFRMVRHH